MVKGRFDGKTAFVSGAGTGIGAATAQLLASQGARVALFGRRLEPLEKQTNVITAGGGRALAVTGDVSRPEDVRAAIDATVREFGALDLAVNNAAIVPESHPVAEIEIEAWNEVIAVNLSGVFYAMKAQIQAMLLGGGGSIVNVSSILGDRAFPCRAAYVTAKHGMRGLTRTAAVEYAKQNIRINELLPGMTASGEMVAANPADSAQLAAATPAGRLADPEEIASAICFLLSDESSFVNGSRLMADAGWLA